MVNKLKGKLLFFLVFFFTSAVAQNASRPVNNQLAEETNTLKNSKGNCSLSINKTISMDIQLLNDLIKNRRSVFPDQFVAGKKVEDTIIEQILVNAIWAPNQGMTEAWHFTVFTGEGLQAFATFQSNLYK